MKNWGKVWKEDKNGSPNPYIQNIYMAYVSQSTLAIYKQWVADGKKIPLEDIIQIATRLVCDGANSLM